MALDRAKHAETPLLSCSKTRGLPGIPPLPPEGAKDPSDLYQIVLRNSEHPPIMRGKSWTLASPFKEQKYHRTPSESIANNYTPSANNLKIRSLPKISLARSCTQPSMTKKRSHSRILRNF
ncbi:dynein heavy chain 3, axonemal-like [Anneissia japonica]|uniref:dynein heavy chain 3, axonemal-like n=1 Tax=Anneissia japonica TaxID=1529436 RepID=UPI00142596CE|nr:dynein heavy chain 3, axonemal-like [Anneissia japonica]